MDGEDPYDALPDAYATALRMRAAGATTDDLAHGLNIDRDAVPALLRLADAKLAEPRPSIERGARSE
ncbi:MAG TPA: hypothetical protein VGI86_01080 [Acidimicrobiia bacterium]